MVVAPSGDLPPCEGVPAKVDKFGPLGGVADDEADTLTLPGETVARLLAHLAARIDREAALERCLRARGMLPPAPALTP